MALPYVAFDNRHDSFRRWAVEKEFTSAHRDNVFLSLQERATAMVLERTCIRIGKKAALNVLE